MKRQPDAEPRTASLEELRAEHDRLGAEIERIDGRADVGLTPAAR